ncbi:MAG: hypothetical protein IPQ07_10220 [Myxococcales bacterium]|nr:hypothetical protein [Myxococcales bacterium]
MPARSVKLVVVALAACASWSSSSGCSGAAHPIAPPLAPPPASTVCYAGMSIGMGQTARTLARRIVDPAAHQIVEDVHHDDGGAHGANQFHVVMAVEGDHFTMTEAAKAFQGSGTLVGDPWRWTSWSSTAEIPNTGITVDSDDELTDTGMTATKQIKRGGKVLGTTKDELKTFDCARWDAAVAELAAPAINDASCGHACRNFATLRFWARADPAIAALPAGDQAAERTKQATLFASQVEAGLPACVEACIAANNGVQTACIAKATSIDQLASCE